MSRWPWPQSAVRIDLRLAVSPCSAGLPDAAAIAWVGSGAGTMPSVRANIARPAKHSICGIATASVRPELVDVRHQRRHAVVAQPAGVDRVGDEVVAEGVHLEQRGHAGGVAEVVA